MGKTPGTTIFKQLIYNVIIPALAALIILGIINYRNTRNLIVERNQAINQIIIDNIKNELEFQDMTFEMLEESMSEKMNGYSNLLASMYFADTRNIEKIDLKAIRDELGMNVQNEDIYIINRDGIIVNTTFDIDRGLNLFGFGEAHKNYLLEVFNGGKFVSERFALEASTKRLKKYSYQPTIDGKYIIEIGFYSENADKITEFMNQTLKNLKKSHSNLISSDLFILTDKPFSLNDSAELQETHKPILDKIFANKTSVTFLSEENGKKIEYTYMYMDRKKSELYKGSAIRLVTDRTQEIRMLQVELIKLLGIFGLAIIIVVFLIYRKTKLITSPIKKLVENINRITHGHLNERAEVIGNNEITTLSEQFNTMIEELESYYNELEQKVKDRTAEIMQQKEEIEAQRDAIEQQRNLLAEINESLESAYKEISEQKKHITDSIVYAKRIQTAILPPFEYIRTVIPEIFILYKPKDIVSGDFYWITEKEGIIMIAAVDCTGHGVPGAFMSIVGSNNLNYAVNVKSARQAGAVLNELNLAVTHTLRQHQSTLEIRDGMDIALLCLNNETGIVEFAGANNPLIMVRDNEVITVEPTKAPIGAYVGEKIRTFNNNVIEMKGNDCYYIFSDGYADQFGGPENKKFMKKRFKELLLQINNLPMEEQKAALESAFEDWKGDKEQIDDILVIGIRNKK